VYISATYKTNRYAKWKERSKLAQQTEDAAEEPEERGSKRPGGPLPASHPAMKKARSAVPAHKRVRLLAIPAAIASSCDRVPSPRSSGRSRS
jgi:hypothetical protein